jgi:gliding motility-associated-like protein
MSMSFIKHIAALGFSLLFGLAAMATHIVGGDFYYKYVGNNQYDVTLKLYVDCENGNPNAIQSDQTAIVGIFNARTNVLVRTENFFRGSPRRLNKSYYTCLVPPKDVCVDEYTYTRRLVLSPGADGLILAFQRCCRNNTISNIVTPESTGATYWCKIPGTGTVRNNNSAVFKELPPNYLCEGAPLTFDHSAIDPDGDSLVYEFYTPFRGATRDDPRPLTPSRPPFSNIFWSNGYSTNAQITGAPSLEIDRRTGLVTVTPNKVGQYVIGIRVLEYRDGQLINETLRDYQMNVRRCQFDLVAAFFAPKYSCSKTVEFEDLSYKAARYRWDFGDPTTDQDVSTEREPTYTYPADGDYEVTLYVENDVCQDEYTFIVSVRSDIQVDLGPDIVLCDRVDQYISSGAFDATKVRWNDGTFGPVYRARGPGQYIAEVFYGNCVGRDTLEISLDPVEFSIPEDSLFCEEVDAVLDAGIAGMKYRWSTSFADTFQTLRVTEPGVYWVRVQNEHCSALDSIRLFTGTKPSLPEYQFVCNEFALDYDAGFVPEGRYLWSDGSTGQVNTITTGGIHWVEVQQRHCVFRDSIMIENSVVPVDLGPDLNHCDSFRVNLRAPENMKRVLWYDGSSVLTKTIDEAGTYYVEVEDTNGCVKADTVRYTITESPVPNLGKDTITICARVIEVLSPGEFFGYQWSTGGNEARISVSEEGQYKVRVVDEVGCSGEDSVYINVDTESLPNYLYIPNAFSPNGDQLNERFPFSEAVEQPEYRVRIYNRWGQMVHDSEGNSEQNWDATFDNQLVAPDAYMYLVEYRGCDGNFKRQSGTVTILR